MVKLRTLCEDYLRENFWLAKKTRDGTDRAFRYLTEFAGNLLVTQLQYRHLEGYKHFIVKSGRAKTTANIYLRSIRTVLVWAIRQGWLQTNPMDGLKEYKITRKSIRIYEDWEVERMVRYAPNLRWKAIILIARTTGLRRGAILNITLQNVRKGFVFVEPKKNTVSTWEWEPKDKEIRKVPVSKAAEQLIGSLDTFYPMLSPQRYDNLLKRKAVSGTLPEEIRNCPDWNFRRTFVNIQRKAFGRQVGDFHSLRKTFTTLMCEQLPEHFVMKLTGHNSSKTMTYYLAARESYYNKARQIASDTVKNGVFGLQLARKEGLLENTPYGRYRT